jgi:hypothetical protein
MASPAEIRAWLDENGRPQSDRGRISGPDRDFYDRAHAALDGGVTGADFGPDEDDDEITGPGPGPEGEPPAPAVADEGRPVTPRARARTRARGRTRADRIMGRIMGEDTKPKGKAKPRGGVKARPRVSLEAFTSRGYEMLGRMAMAVSVPTGRCLQAQAPMAGILLEDAVRGTAADRFMQPLARAERQLDRGFALLAPPVLVFAIDAASGLEPAAAAARHAILVPMLREALLISMRVTDQYAEQLAARMTEDAANAARVDQLIAVIFGQAAAEGEPVPEPAVA